MNSTLFAGILLITSFAIGTNIEDLSDNLRVEEGKFSLFKYILGNNNDYKVDVILDRKKKELTFLGVSLFQKPELVRKLNSTYNTNLRSGDLINSRQYVDSVLLYGSDDLNKFILGGYYLAKNWDYDRTNYFSELRLIENRIAFSQSGTRICFFLFLSFFLYYLVKRMTRKKVSRRFILFLTINFIALVIFPLNYKSVNEMYNERVFGYYVDHFSHNQIDIEAGILPCQD